MTLYVAQLAKIKIPNQPMIRFTPINKRIEDCTMTLTGNFSLVDSAKLDHRTTENL